MPILRGKSYPASKHPQRKYSEDQVRDEGGRWTSGGAESIQPGEPSTIPEHAGEGLPATRVVGGKDDEIAMQERQGMAWQAGQELALDRYNARFAEFHASPEEGAAMGAKSIVSENLAEAIGLSQKDASDLVNGWAHTSNDDDYRAMWMQKMAAEEFGVPLSDWQREKVEKFEASIERQRVEFESAQGDPMTARAGAELTMSANHQNPFEALSSGTTASDLVPASHLDPFSAIESQNRLPYGDSATHEEQGRAFLRAQYDATQAFFKEQGVTEVVAYRGQKYQFQEGESVVNNPNIPNEGDRLQGADNAMESWSLSDETASDFATSANPGTFGYIERMVVPVERILGTPFTGYGCLREQEIVVLGGAGEAEVIDAGL